MILKTSVCDSYFEFETKFLLKNWLQCLTLEINIEIIKKILIRADNLSCIKNYKYSILAQVSVNDELCI